MASSRNFVSLDPLSRIASHLGDLQRQVRAVRARQDARAVLVLVVTAFAVAVPTLALVPNDGVRVFLGVLTGLGVLALALGAGPAGRRQAGSLQTIAQRLEAQIPALRNDVRAALESAQTPNDEDPLRRALQERLVARVAATMDAEPARLRVVVPVDNPRPALAAVGVALACSAVMAVAWPQWKAGLAVLVYGVPVVSETGATVARESVLHAVDLSIEPPEYTGLRPRWVAGTEGRVEALRGSRVRVMARARQPVRSARLLVTTAQDTTSVDAQVHGTTELDATFRVDGPGHWTVELLDLDGNPVADPVQRDIVLVADEPPQVALTAPVGDQEVVPDMILDLEYTAADAFGLAGTRVVWFFVGDEDRRYEQPLHETALGKSFTEHVPFDLQALRLQARDEVRLWVEAWDNLPIDGPNVGRSAEIALRVSAPDDLHDQVLERKVALFEAMLARLGESLPDRLNNWEATDPTAATEGRRTDATLLRAVPRPVEPAQVAANLARARDTMTAWAETLAAWDDLVVLMERDELSVVRDIETLRVWGAQVRGDLEAWAATIGELGPLIDAGGVPETRLGDARTRNATYLMTIERAALLLDDRILAHRADDVQRATEELAGLRERLRELLQQYRDTQDPALREQIEAELRRMQNRMRELMERLASQIDQLPEEHLNREGLEASEVSEQVVQMRSAMDEMRAMLDAGDIDGALQALDQMGDQLDALQNELDPAMDSAQEQGLSEADRQLSEFMEELGNLEALQQEIAQETEALDAEIARQRQEEMQQEIDNVLAWALAQVQAVQDRIDQAGDDLLSSETQGRLQDTRASLQRIVSSLRLRDIPASLDHIEQGTTRMIDAAWPLRRDVSLLRRNPPAARQSTSQEQNVSNGVQTLDEVASRLRELQRQLQPQPSAGQRQQQQQLQERQGAAQQRLQQLQQRMSESGQPVPEPAQQGLQQADEGMGEAGEQLGGRTPRPAMRGQQQAIQGLRGARQAMQQQMQQQRQSERMGRQRQQRVEIPGEQGHDRTRFRQQVLDGMREGALESFEDTVQRYYERLVR